MNVWNFPLRTAAMLLVLALAGCANVSKVASGETVIRNRLAIQVDRDWNQFERGLADDTPTWTTEGITIDALQFYVGIKNGELIAPTPKGGKGSVPLAFKSTMQAAEIVTLYQNLLTRDGSSFTLDKLDPATFVGAPGFRFEYSLVRKIDDVRLRGVAWGAVYQGELFLINYSAPRLGFFQRSVGEVDQMVKTARIKS